ncbi:MAG: MFS transporter [Acidimicrobiales bacterium]
MPARRSSPVSWLWSRSLDRYPDRGRRVAYLTIVVLSTIMLYYELYVGGAVSPTILAHYGMSFRYYVYGVGVFAGIAGAFFSLLAGAGDRWGRANMVTYGLLITAILVLFLPSMPSAFWYMFLVAAIGAVEGVVLVATPALVRDYSPQLGRASAMGFWTLGPVCGSLVVAIVSSNTLTHLHSWQDQFTICGIVGLGLFGVALFGLRELSPGLRGQLMVSLRDRMLVEARAQGIDVAASLKKPWRQMIKWDLVVPAFGAAVLLLVYYAMVGFLVIYFAGIFGFSTQKANTLGDWFWAFDAGGLVVVGYLSDKLRVRKPFMVFGAVVAAVMTIIFLTRTTHPHTSFTTFVIVMSILAVGLAIAYAPWFAAFTETAERRNPALMATGLAVNGWVLRAVVTVMSLLLPIVVSSMTPIVTYGARVVALAKQYAPELATAAAVPKPTLAALTANPSTAKSLGVAVTDISTKLHVPAGTAVTRLIALGKAAKEPGFKFLAAHSPAVVSASKVAPTQWEHWWWVCVAGEVVFIPTIFLMTGRWSPAAAKRDAEEHERMVEAELAHLRAPAGPPPAPEPTVAL